MKKLTLALGVGLSACVATTNLTTWKQTGWSAYFRDTQDKTTFVTRSFDPYILQITRSRPNMLLPPKFVDSSILNDLCGKTRGGCAKPDLAYVAIIEPKSPKSITDILNPSHLDQEQLEFASNYIYEQCRYILRDSNRAQEIHELKAIVSSLVVIDAFTSKESENIGRPVMANFLAQLPLYLPQVAIDNYSDFSSMKRGLEQRGFGHQQIGTLAFGYLLASFDFQIPELYEFLSRSTDEAIISRISSSMSYNPTSKINEFIELKNSKDHGKYVCEVADKSELSFACSIRNPPDEQVKSNPFAYAVPAKKVDMNFENGGYYGSGAFSLTSTFEHAEAQRILRIIRDAPEMLDRFSNTNWTFKRYSRSDQYSIQGDVVYGRNDNLFVILDYYMQHGDRNQTLQTISLYYRTRDGKALDITYSVNPNTTEELKFVPNLPTSLRKDYDKIGEDYFWTGFSPNKDLYESAKDPKLSLARDIAAIADKSYVARVKKTLRNILSKVPNSNK